MAMPGPLTLALPVAMPKSCFSRCLAETVERHPNPRVVILARLDPERDLERMVPDSTPAHALLDSLIARLKVVFPPPRARTDSTKPQEP